MEGEVCCQADDACVFVGAMPLDDAKASISQATPGVTCHYLQEQSQFLARHPFIVQSTRGFRWIHVDGEHTGQSVINDLEIADHLLSDRGIAVFDDFFSPGYPQVTQAIFQFLATRPGRFALVLCGFNKGYLCRPKAAGEYLQFVRTSLYSNMADRVLPSQPLADFGHGAKVYGGAILARVIQFAVSVELLCPLGVQPHV